MLSDETKQAIFKLQRRYPEKRSALLPALHLAQAEAGYLPCEVQEEVARLFELDVNEVNGVVSFYDMFHDQPVGKHHLHVCKNISCMLRGADGLLARLCQKLQAAPGETTSDGAFTIIASECLAACDRAPVMLVDDKVVGPVKEEEIEEILHKARQGHGHPSPIDIKEVNHA
ncbi:MAG: NADH-quinone oxidoreductase subunit NuoE [Parachlamydia sp.]|jgi:NADH-quinone oxidoreductase subunit E|nr:NADH-quinone oxidoreductase subunit NuoE [Parachlamydia sp.]